VSCVSDVDSVSVLFILDCPFSLFWRLICPVCCVYDVDSVSVLFILDCPFCLL
jgi:hypothetical protein